MPKYLRGQACWRQCITGNERHRSQLSAARSTPFIEVDLKDMEVGQSFHLSQIVFPKGVAPTAHTDDDPVVVTISAKKAEVVEEGEGEREGEGEGEAATPAA